MSEESTLAGKSGAPAQHPYDQHYYDTYHTGAGPVPYVRERGPWLQLFRTTAEFIERTIKPQRVLDAGCAKGFLVEALRDRGIDAFGVDISEYAISEVRPDIRSFCRVGSLVDPLPERYDLITCIEVVEHLTEEEARRAIANICQSTSDVLFSSSPDDFDEPTHVTVRPRSYWVDRFAECGFSLDAEFEAKVIAPHAMRFRMAVPRYYAVDALLDLRDRLRDDMQSLHHAARVSAGQIAYLQSRLEFMERSMGWRVLERIRGTRDRIAPPGTRRAWMYSGLCQAVKVGMDSGFNAGVRHFASALSGTFKGRKGGDSEPTASGEVSKGPVIFKEHALAHTLLDGMVGLEIGPAAHNPFGLRTRTVELTESRDFYASVQQNVMGVVPPHVDIWASADSIPLPDQSEDFILSSHVVEHLPNVVAAFIEWNRIVRDGGYIFMIVPLPWALPADKDRDLTAVDHFLEDYERCHTLETHPVEGVPGGKMGHYHTFLPDTLLKVVNWMCAQSLCDWELVAREDIDTKVGNGFTLAFKVRHKPLSHADSTV